MKKFRNFYHCSKCNTYWQDDGNHTCNDRCPKCDTETQPYESQDISSKIIERHFLVKYTHKCGEYEFSGHTILTLKPKKNIRTEVHKYFMDFYGSNVYRKSNCTEFNRGNSYYYNGGEVAVHRIFCRKITEAQKLAIKQFNL
jgi:hypothetical protein